MKPGEYTAACEELGWTHAETGRILGLSRRTPYRYANGETAISEPAARLLRLLVRLHLTIPARKFNEIVQELRT